MPQGAKSFTMGELKKRVLAKATKAPKTGAELAARVGLDGYDARALGRPIGELVAEGKLQKNASRVPTYQRVD